MLNGYMLLAGLAGAILLTVILILIAFRVVVKTNEVVIVQSGKKTVSFGKDQESGNVYYAWPSWVPRWGVTTIRLPTSVFAQNLNNYSAYDKGRVPFTIDTIAFFRIGDSNVAAQRVASFAELQVQLEGIQKGAMRSILASSEIEEILEGRSKFGEMFTNEVQMQLKQWGVTTVKNIELMDIRDADGSEVIENIMAKKKSLIAMQSRVEVAGNMRTAQVAEIEATQVAEVRKREAQQMIGQREAERDKEVGISQQQAHQAIKEEERATAEKDMAVQRVQTVRKSEIVRDAAIVSADQARQVNIIAAEAQQQQTIIVAEGDLEGAKRNAEAVTVQGVAKGEAEKAILLAPVQAQITLAKEIGANPAYQTYLVSIRQIEANQVVGIEQAHALQAAEIKVIANAGTPIEGVKSAMELLTPKGGTQIGSMLEAFKNTEVGAAVISAVTNGSAKDARA